jgi:DNA-binding response OmpR family regulator
LEYDLIWIFDNDPESFSLYRQTVGLHYDIRWLHSAGSFVEEAAKSDLESPKLIIVDPENLDLELKGVVSEICIKKSHPRFSNLPCVVVSEIDSLQTMRNYLKSGALDYLLKPIRPNELIAKVEKALNQNSNREILLLKNDLDGIQINDLTFREHQLLTIFLSRPTRSVQRKELYDAIWTKVTVNRKTLDVHLFNLRRKLRPHGYDVLCRNQVFSLEKHSSTK